MGLKTLHDMITGGAQDAGDYAAQVAARQRDFLQNQWMQLQGMQTPFIQQGQQAFGLYNQFTGGAGAQAQQQALQNFQMSQPAQFGLQQNIKGIQQNAAATGGIFGGNRLMQEQAAGTQAYQSDLSNYIERLRAQAGLGQQAASALGGVGSIAGQGIGSAMMGIGDARANAALAGSQAQGQAAQGATQVGGALLAMFSDERLKDNIRMIGTHNDLGVYTWTWNDKANEVGLSGEGMGHIAQEVELKHPDLVVTIGDYKAVIYGDGRTMEAV